MFKTALAAENIVQRAFARVPKRRVSQVMTKRDRLGQVFVEPKSARDRPAYASNLKRMRQARSVMVAFRLQKYLRFMLQPAK